MTFASVSHSGVLKARDLPYDEPYGIDYGSGGIQWAAFNGRHSGLGSSRIGVCLNESRQQANSRSCVRGIE